jgi:tetratricopeptide (TPR) repeat protein
MQGAFDKLAEIRPTLAKGPEPGFHEDEFLQAADLVPVRRQTADNRRRLALAELAEIFREKRWQQALDLFYPVEEKLPELADLGQDAAVREKLAFALGQLGRFDDAIAQLQVCVTKEPENFYPHSALAYTAYNSLFAARNREVFLRGRIRDDRIALAHRHFAEAQRLRPDGVTNFYRQGMLWHKLEDKPQKALPLFDRAVANWEALSDDDKDRRQQERKNFVKALYQKAGILLTRGDCRGAARTLKRCMAEDEKSNYLSRLHKYFALGKVEYHAGRLPEAKNALLFAERCADRAPVDFVFELLARVYLGLNDPQKAMAAIAQVPEKNRRPYVRWTEADVLCAQERYDRAKAVLEACTQRDRRSRHKGLVRLCRIDYLMGNYRQVMAHAREADRFFRDLWTNPCADALFWMAAAALRAGEGDQARSAALELRDFQPGYPKLDRLLARVDGKGGGHERQT